MKTHGQEVLQAAATTFYQSCQKKVGHQLGETWVEDRDTAAPLDQFSQWT